MPKTPAERVDWELRKLPSFQVAYQAISRCPHGDGEHNVFGHVGRIIEQAPGLSVLHRSAMGCRCPLGRVVIDGLVVVDGGIPV